MYKIRLKGREEMKKEENKKSLKEMLENTKIEKSEVVDNLKTSFISYAMAVNVSRAIPDVRDGLKIGLRQGLYAQYTNHLTHNDKFQKAQKSVSAAMSQSYEHGR